MNLDFDELQLMLRTQARDFIEEQCPPKTVKEIVLSESGFSEEVWNGMAELGWMGIPFAEDCGGAGMTFFDTLMTIEEMGRGAVPGPYLSTIICGMAIAEFGTEEQIQEYVAKIAMGELKFALAWTETNASFEPSGIELKAVEDGTSGFKLSGSKLFVSDATVVDHFLLVTRTETDENNPAHGITLFITPAKDAAIKVSPQDTIGFDRQAKIEFDGLMVSEEDMLGELNRGWIIVQKLLNWGALGKCAEMIGAANRAFEMTVDYANDRVQYRRHIGAFQVQQHRIADMYIALESARNHFYEAAWLVSSGAEDQMLLSKCKAMISESADFVTEMAARVHGAIGITWDHDLGLLYRRVRAAALQFGSPAYHKEKMAQALEASSI